MSFNGIISEKRAAIVLLFLLIITSAAEGQNGILDSLFTFRAGSIKTGAALDIITRRTGYNFTYDSRLINTEKKTDLSYRQLRLGSILDSLFMNDTLQFSVIDKYIIISRVEIASISYPVAITLPEINYITGVIIDEETSDPLPYATIALVNSGKGTVSNNSGEFGLKILTEALTDTLSVSYLGYYRREMAVKQAIGNNFTIAMKREFISIPEIIIKNQIPKELIIKARSAIPSNYGNTPAMMTGFYREGVMKKAELQTYSEAVLELYKSAYSGTIFNDQIKVYKSRKIENTDRSDTLAIRLKAGLSTCLELDGARNIFDFISNESIDDYSYRMTDIVTYDDETAYAIEFQQREDVDLPLFKGIVYINTTDYGILHAEFELNQAQIHKMKNSFVSNSSRGFNTWPVSVKYSVSYRKTGQRYFLSHVRGDLVFASKQKKKLFSSMFNVFFELAITDTRLEDVKRFEREELAPIHSIFSKTISDYDPMFWGNQDFLRPEDNLLQALKNMNVRLQEFSK
jgi:hypothetical protein